MIDIQATIPEWMVWFFCFGAGLYCLQAVLDVYIFILKWQLKKRGGIPSE